MISPPKDRLFPKNHPPRADVFGGPPAPAPPALRVGGFGDVHQGSLESCRSVYTDASVDHIYICIYIYMYIENIFIYIYANICELWFSIDSLLFFFLGGGGGRGELKVQRIRVE